MINIIDSANVRTTSTAQDVLNSIADLWEWKEVVYNTESEGDVSELWASDEVCLFVTSQTSSTTTLAVKHKSLGLQKILGSSNTWSHHKIVKTDKCLVIHTAVLGNSNAAIIVIANSFSDKTSKRSCGIFTQTGTKTVNDIIANCTVVTDDCTSLDATFRPIYNANYYTVFASLNATNGYSHLVGVNQIVSTTIASESATNFEYVFESADGDEHYYIVGAVAIPYTLEEA